MASPSPHHPQTPAVEESHEKDHQPPVRSHTIDVVEHRINSGFNSVKRSFTPRGRKSNLPLEAWATPPHPYHEYVRTLVAAGWNNLQNLDSYLSTHTTQNALVVSVLDISQGSEDVKHWPDIHSELDLKGFLAADNRGGANVRIFAVEYQGTPSPALIETLGGALKLDPRFFQWSINSNSHVFTPSQRHRAPYLTLDFGVLDPSTSSTTDAERFRVLVYIQPGETSNEWTGVILFSSSTKINLSPRILTDPPAFGSELPPPASLEPRTFRELYLKSFRSVDVLHVPASPFYAVSSLFRLNCYCWNEIIAAIRAEDNRIQGISDTSVGHTEEIKKSLTVVQRGGSLGWPGRDEPISKQSQTALEEDFKHLVNQTDLLWQIREKMAAIQRRNADTRWTSLTNAFTYIFAPVTIMTGIYGMNVSQISGDTSNPNIWQFFVAVAIFNAVVVIALSISVWVQIQVKHGRKAGLKEILGYSIGKVGSR
ncbi:hypothetical protein DL95DRAFT_345754 [Leptodontidium sp. 2 PMI_412]|nr:hypothetical protein DL95DRAFT_345754 [Leptodontidium sp. 2 PMI_412]